MPRYIDADALKENLNQIARDTFTLADYYEHFIKGLMRADDAVNEQQTADVVEVVRCKDCKYHDDIDTYGTVYCPNVIGGWVSERFFCAGGERRTDDDRNG